MRCYLLFELQLYYCISAAERGLQGEHLNNVESRKTKLKGCSTAADQKRAIRRLGSIVVRLPTRGAYEGHADSEWRMGWAMNGGQLLNGNDSGYYVTEPVPWMVSDRPARHS